MYTWYHNQIYLDQRFSILEVLDFKKFTLDNRCDLISFYIYFLVLIVIQLFIYFD